MFLEFPDDRTTHHLDRQYMLGPSLLVAPVFVPIEEESEYYLPAGRWTYLWCDGARTIDGPVWIKERVPINEIPIWVRPGTILCMGPAGIGRPDYDYGADVHVRVYGLQEGQAVRTDIPPQKGVDSIANVSAEKKEGRIVVKVAQGGCRLSSSKVFDQDPSVTGTIQEQD